MTVHQTRVYFKTGCPHSMRLRIFLSEANLENEVEMVTVESASELDPALLAMAKQSQIPLTFPFSVQASNDVELDSQVIIGRMTSEHNVDPHSLNLLRYYEDSMIPRFSKMFMELKRLKGAEWDGSL